jgi:WD40 repeat protein
MSSEQKDTSPAASGAGSPVGTYEKSDVRKKFEADTVKSVYSNIIGAEPSIHSKHQYAYDLHLGSNLPLSENMVASRKFFAVPWFAGGGSATAVFETAAEVGRANPKKAMIRGHKSQITAFQFNPFNDNELATGSGEGVVMLWQIPDGGLKENMQEEHARIRLQCDGTLRQICYHNLVQGVMVTSSSGQKGHDLVMWDSEEERAVYTMMCHDAEVMDVQFDYQCKLIATTCKDRKIRVLDMKQDKVVACFEAPESVRDTRVVWVDNEHLLTIGFAEKSVRSISLFNIADTSKPIVTEEVDYGASTLVPRYDRNSGLLVVFGNGERTFHFFHIRPGHTSKVIERCVPWPSNADVRGIALLPKDVCDVSKVEIMRVLKLTKDAVIPTTFRVPRKRSEYYQDDLYTDDLVTPQMSAPEFFQDSGPALRYASLRPNDMTPLSEAPEDELTVREQRYHAHLSREQAEKPTGLLGHKSVEDTHDHFRNIAKMMPTSNRFDTKQEDGDMISDGEWSD